MTLSEVVLPQLPTSSTPQAGNHAPAADSSLSSAIYVICLTGEKRDFEIEIEVTKTLNSRVQNLAQTRDQSVHVCLKRLVEDWLEDGQMFVDQQSLRKLLLEEDAS